MNKFKSNKGYFDAVEISFITAIVILFSVFIFCIFYHCNVTMPNAYKAWCKQTGNEKQLSYEEWKDLMAATENQNANSVIIIHH